MIAVPGLKKRAIGHIIGRWPNGLSGQMTEPAQPDAAAELLADKVTESRIITEPDGLLSDPEALIGQTIDGKYVIESYIGGGGMSQVYRARHLLIKTKVVAIKVLQSQRGLDAHHIMRLQQEANAVSHLSHPNIIAVQDFGVAAGGQSYMVMDYFEGRSLDDVLKSEQRLSVDKLLDFVNQTCSALAHAHEKGVVHRDIKPSNIMVGKDEQGNDIVKVVDFGIAKLTEEESERGRLTKTGDVVGSPLYMSPEQCLGQPVDGRTDIYSLGCVMYECITGNSPFAGASILETLHKQMNESPSKFPARVTDDRRQSALEAIVLKMLAKSPANRFQYMVEVATELKRLGSGSTHSALGQMRIMWGLWKARREAQSQKTAVIDVCLLVSSLMAFVTAAVMIWTPIHIKMVTPEFQRTAEVMRLLDESMSRLRDRSLVTEILLNPETTVDDKRNLIANFEEMFALCQGRPDELVSLDALRDGVNQGAGMSANFKRSIFEAIRAQLFHRQIAPEEDTLGQTLVAWTNALAHGSVLNATVTSKHRAAESQIITCFTAFTVSLVAAVILMIVLAVLLAMKLKLRPH